MNSRFKKLLAIAVLLMLPIGAFADLGLPNLFPTSTYDVSIDFLTRIFGHVPGVLYGTNFQLVAQLAKIFNTALVSVMGALFTYTTLKVTLHAAHEGEMMAGKGKSLGMAVMRSVTGLSLAIPAGSGYCAGQIIVLWIAVQGIGLGNMAWKGVVDYIVQGGAIYQKADADAVDAPAMVPIANEFAKVLQSEACVYKLQSIYTAQKSKEMQTSSELAASGAGDYATTSTSSPSASEVFGFGLNSDGQSFNFGTKNLSYAGTGAVMPAPYQQNAYNAECGQISVASLVAFVNTNKKSSDKDTTAADSLVTAASSLVTFIEPAAKQLAAYDPAKKDSTLADYLAGTIAMATTDYTQTIMPARKKQGETAMDKKRDQLRQSLNQGWMTAGAYYLLMGQLSAAGNQPLSKFSPKVIANGFSDFGFNNPSSATQGSAHYDVNSMSEADRKSLVNTLKMGVEVDSQGKERVGFDNDVVPVYNAYLNAFAQAGAAHASYATSTVNLNSSSAHFNTGRYRAGSWSVEDWAQLGLNNRSTLQVAVDNLSLVGFSGGPVAGPTMTIWAYKMKSLAGDFKKAIAPDSLDPLVKLQRFGTQLQAAAVSYFMASIFAMFASVFATSLIPSYTISTAMKASAEIPSLLITIWVGMCFTLGAALGYYLVLILFIVWFTSIISYIGHIFQSVFGVILLLLRLTDPEGEGIIGKAGEGLTMLFALCLTPFLLVAGFVVSMVATKEALLLLNYMFNTFMATTISVWEANPETWLIIGLPLVVTIYTTIVVSLVQLIATLCLTDGINHIKGFFAAAAASQRVAGEMHQDTKGAATGQGSSHGQAVGGGAGGATKAGGNKETTDELTGKGKDDKAQVS